MKERKNSIEQDINSILNRFDSIDLKSLMNKAELMNRVDTKYFFSITELPSFLACLQEDYYVLEIKDIRQSPYESLYFDTPEYKMYLMHHNRKLNRYKIRYRRYISTDISFFEIKFKNNKKRTHKTRIPINQINTQVQENERQLIQTITPFDVKKLRPVLWVYYKRITLAHKKNEERITIDVGLHYKTQNKLVRHPELTVVEVKQARINRRSKAVQCLLNKRIFPDRISKYCLGILQTENVKYNRFKPKLLKIYRMKNDYNVHIGR